MKQGWTVAAILVMIVGIFTFLDNNPRSRSNKVAIKYFAAAPVARTSLSPQSDKEVELEAPKELTVRSPAKFDDSVLQFGSYSCTVDCSGHEAGYQWAEDNSISDVEDCDGNSESFIEGCRQYADEQEGQSVTENDREAEEAEEQ